MSGTASFCARLAAITAATLTADAIERAKQLVLDGLAISVAGTTEPAIRKLAGHHRRAGGPAVASLIGLGERLTPMAAATVNGAAMHVLDFEPMWSPANHALSTTLPAVLALAETQGASGLEVLTALVKGIEAQGWLREASGQYEPRKLVFHPPGVVGPIGAAVAAGHLLQLDAGKLAHAIGIAASRSGALLANVGTMMKSLHCGDAAAAGLDAALLAKEGFTANPDILGAPQGLAAGFFAGTFQRDMLDRPGPPFRLVTPGYALKMFPSQYGTHFGVVAALRLRALLPPGTAIERCVLTAPVMPYIDRRRPGSGLEGKFSLQFTACAALLDGMVGIGTFTDERSAQPDMQDMLSRLELVMDPSIPAHFEAMHVTIEARTNTGASILARCDGPDGRWDKTPITPAAHQAKVLDCFAAAGVAWAAEGCIGLVEQLDTMDAVGVRALLDAARAAHTN